MKITVKDFKKLYWNYFLELEEELLSTRKYVSFDLNNFKTYSNEYIKLMDITCSEIDVIAKVILNFNNEKYVDYKNISNWGYNLQQLFPNIQNYEVLFDNEIVLKPFDKWKYEKSINKNGAEGIKLQKNCETPKWWNGYNKVKHHRTDKYDSGYQYYRANLENVINSFAALYILELLLFRLIAPNDRFIKYNIENNKLFEIQDSKLQEIITKNYIYV